MEFKFNGCGISGLLFIVPSNERTFVDDMKKFNFSESRSMKLKNVMGYDKHRVVAGNVCVSDMAVAGFEHLFNSGLLERDAVDAIILVTASPDNFLPPTSYTIHGRLGLKNDMILLDICQGCSGFVIGLIQAYTLLHHDSIKKIALVTADVLSRKVSEKDRNSYPLIGDAASITIIERDSSAGDVYANVKVDGAGCNALIIPAGGFRLPSSQDTAVMEADEEGNYRSKDNLYMDGSAVFNFAMAKVPPMIDSLMSFANEKKDNVDYFVFHQPNRFMLQKLAEDIGVPFEKMPSNVVEKYGNSSGSTIPATLALNLPERLLNETLNLCFAGFGVGLTWSSMFTRCGPLKFCETMEFN